MQEFPLTWAHFSSNISFKLLFHNAILVSFEYWYLQLLENPSTILNKRFFMSDFESDFD